MNPGSPGSGSGRSAACPEIDRFWVRSPPGARITRIGPADTAQRRQGRPSQPPQQLQGFCDGGRAKSHSIPVKPETGRPGADETEERLIGRCPLTSRARTGLAGPGNWKRCPQPTRGDDVPQGYSSPRAETTAQRGRPATRRSTVQRHFRERATWTSRGFPFDQGEDLFHILHRPPISPGKPLSPLFMENVGGVVGADDRVPWNSKRRPRVRCDSLVQADQVVERRLCPDRRWPRRQDVDLLPGDRKTGLHLIGIGLPVLGCAAFD